MYRLSLVRKPGRALSAIMPGSYNLLFNPFSKFLRCDGLAGQCYGVFSPWGIPAGASLALARVPARPRAASQLRARALSKSPHLASRIAIRPVRIRPITAPESRAGPIIGRDRKSRPILMRSGVISTDA